MSEGVADSYPVTEMQRLMLSKSIQHGCGVYRPQMVFEITDPDFCVDTFRQATNVLFARHAVLRTRFAKVGEDDFMQMVQERAAPIIECTNLLGMSAADQAAVISRYLAQSVADSFDVAADAPLIRFDLFWRAQGMWQLVMTTHHAIEDGWGMVELLAELEQVYRQISAGAVGEAATVAVNGMKEHVALEIQAADNPLARQFWEHRIADVLPMMLPGVQPAHVDGTEVHEFAITGSRLQELKHQAAMSHVPLKILFLAAYSNSLARVLDRRQVVVDVVSNGRSNRLSDPLHAQGLFWSFLPIGVSSMSLTSEMLRELHASVLDAEAHAAFPVRKLLRAQGVTDLTCAAFNYVHFHHDQPQRAALMRYEYGVDRFHHPLQLVVSLSPDTTNVHVALHAVATPVVAQIAAALGRELGAWIAAEPT
ncbi:condensation domain-containing protein [Eleftheria terrae]|uniref:condensation domain-containing protein n=1 Tax=Eleftheria terrae TaxID=1597781 RepID=UPI003F4DFEC3